MLTKCISHTSSKRYVNNIQNEVSNIDLEDNSIKNKEDKKNEVEDEK